MGLFKQFRRMFDKNIDNDSAYDGELVHLYSKQPATLHIGYNIVVRPGYSAVFVVRDKVTDVLGSGKFRLGLENLPITFHKLKLDRIGKRAMPTKFRADIYYVNTSEYNISFLGDKPYTNKSKEYGKVSAYAEGECVLNIIDAGDLVAYLILERATVSNKQAIKDCSTIIGNACNKALEKAKLSPKQIIDDPSNASKMAEQNINEYFEDYGISVNKVNLKYFNMSSKKQQTLEQSQPHVEAEQANQPIANIEEYEPTFVVEGQSEPTTITPQENPEPAIEEIQPVIVTDEANQDNSQPTTADHIITCPNCDAKVQTNNHFCPNCGMNLDELRN